MAMKYEFELIEEYEIKNILTEKQYADRATLDYTIAYQIKGLGDLAKKYMLHDPDALITDVHTHILNLNNHIYPNAVVVVTTANVFRKKVVK
jgi:hypothetical protein